MKGGKPAEEMKQKVPYVLWAVEDMIFRAVRNEFSWSVHYDGWPNNFLEFRPKIVSSIIEFGK